MRLTHFQERKLQYSNYEEAKHIINAESHTVVWMSVTGKVLYTSIVLKVVHGYMCALRALRLVSKIGKG